MSIKITEEAIQAGAATSSTGRSESWGYKNRIRDILTAAAPHLEVEGITIDATVPDGEFYYLAGPMTGYKQHNFPEFKRVAARLQEAGYTICSPADLDQPIYDEVMAGDGEQVHLRSDSPLGFELLRRDVNIVMHPRCIGVICLHGWEESPGALIETFVGDRFRRNLYAYCEDEHDFQLVMFDRDLTLKHFESKKLLDKMQEAPPLLGSQTGRMSCGRLELDPLGATRKVRELPLSRIGVGLDIPRGRRAV